MTTEYAFPQVFKLVGEVDLARQAELDAIAAAAAEARLAIVDMTEVTFIDSTALSWLVRTKKTLVEGDGWLRVVAPPGVVTRLVSVAGLEELIDVYPTHLEATGT